MDRLDKILANTGVGSRSHVVKLIRSGLVCVNGDIVTDPAVKINPSSAEISVNNDKIIYKEHYHIMLNKPKGIICATYDARDKTVLDLIDDAFPKNRLFPAGRLDKDTEGFVLLTTDGQFGHKVTGAKSNVEKLYYVEIDGNFEDDFAEKFKNGIVIDGGYKCLPARLEIIGTHSCRLTITVGKFHQIKRMFEALGRKVTYLKRLKIGNLYLDETLSLGEYRELTENEVNMLL